MVFFPDISQSAAARWRQKKSAFFTLATIAPRQIIRNRKIKKDCKDNIITFESNLNAAQIKPKKRNGVDLKSKIVFFSKNFSQKVL